jgi:8-oxo-dGTP diphosphatase
VSLGVDGPVIRIVAAVALNARGEILLVRKRGTSVFMLPGGKPAFEEPALDALEREIREELGCGLDHAACRALGTFHAPAANEPGCTVEAELFASSLVGDPRPSGEVDEMVWIDPEREVPYPLAQMARQHALRLARALKSTARTAPQ